MDHGAHKNPDTFARYYAPKNPGTDGQGSYFGRSQLRTIVADCFRAMTLSHNPGLWQALPAEKLHELESTAKFQELEYELERLALESPAQDDDATRRRRKELQAQRRKLVAEELRACQEQQPKLLGPHKSRLGGHHSTVFDRVRRHMPERDGLSQHLFTVAHLRDDVGYLALEALVALCRQKHEVNTRRGLEPDKCHCGKVDADLRTSKYATLRSPLASPLLTLSQKACGNGVASYIQLPQAASEEDARIRAVLLPLRRVDDDSRRMARALRMASEQARDDSIPVLSTRAWRYRRRFRILCLLLGNERLPPTKRMEQFLDRTFWKDQMQDHLDHLDHLSDDKASLCSLYTFGCTKAFHSKQEWRFHLEDMHCADFARAPKYSSSPEEPTADASPLPKPKRKVVARRRAKKIEDGNWAGIKLEFVNETSNIQNRYLRPKRAASTTSSEPTDSDERECSPDASTSRRSMY